MSGSRSFTSTGRRDDARLFPLLDQLGEVASFQGTLAREYFIQHEAKRVDVAADRHFAARQLFRGHVGRRPCADRFARGSRKAEVSDAHFARAVDHHIRRLEIPVDDAPLVRGGEAGADLSRDLERAILRKAPYSPEQRREILAVHVLHRQERVALDFIDVVHAADVRMRHLPRHPDLRVELGEPRGIPVHVAPQEFQRHRLSKLQVVGAKHFPHSALSEPADDAVAPAEEGARREAAVIDIAGRREQPAAGRSLRRSRSARWRFRGPVPQSRPIPIVQGAGSELRHVGVTRAARTGAVRGEGSGALRAGGHGRIVVGSPARPGGRGFRSRRSGFGVRRSFVDWVTSCCAAEERDCRLRLSTVDCPADCDCRLMTVDR